MSSFMEEIPGLPVDRKPAKRPPVDSNCVTYTVPRCPQCGSSHCPAYSTSQGPLKYRKCAACGHLFKSFILNWNSDLDQESPP
jgi:hypothetical protein